MLNSHCVSINIETEKPFDIEDIKELLADYPGIVVEDNIEELIYPMPINSKGKDEVYIGRIRRDFTVDNGINLWSCADNIRKGAATNAVQIAEKLLEI